MSDTRPVPLGVGNLISAGFALAFATAMPLMLVAVLPSVAQFLARLVASGSLTTALNIAEPIFSDGWEMVAISLIYYPVAALLSGTLAICSYLKATGRPINLAGGLGATLVVVHWLLLLNLIVALLGTLGLLLLILPGLYIFSTYICVVHAVVIERRGFGALGRAASLSRGYRWPILGGMVLMGILMILLQILVSAVPVALFFSLDAFLGLEELSLGAAFLVTLLSSLSGAVQLLVFACFGTCIYVRLRNIKEGTGTEDVARVFE